MKSKKTESEHDKLILVVCHICNHKWFENYDLKLDIPGFHKGKTIVCPYCDTIFDTDT